MSMLAELKAQILETVEIHGPICYRDLSIAVADFADNHKQITNQVYNLKKSGQIDQLPDGGYVMPGFDSADDEHTSPAAPRVDPAPRVIDEPLQVARQVEPAAAGEQGNGEFEFHGVEDLDDPELDDEDLDDSELDDIGIIKDYFVAGYFDDDPNRTVDGIDDPDDDDTVWYPQPLVREILEDQLLTAQKALDDYLMLVGEPRIIACLRAPRDAARKALEQLEED